VSSFGRTLAAHLLLPLLAFAAPGWPGAWAQGAPDAPAATLPSDLAFVAPDGRLAWLPAGEARIRTIGSPTGRHAFPAWSPDGRRLAVIVRDADGARAEVVDLGVAGAGAGGGARRAVWFEEADEPVIYLDWADDGASLLLLVADADAGFRLVRADANGRRTLARGAPLYWDQRADGGVVVHAGGPSGSRLTLVDAAGRETGELPRPGAFRSPAVSPSGDWLAYGAQERDGARRVLVVPAPDATPAASANTDGAAFADGRRALGHRGLSAFAWHPARDLLALTRPLSDVPHSFGPLGGLDAASGRFAPWVDEPVVAFWWSPDGRRVAVLAVDAAGGGPVAGSGGAPIPVGLRRAQAEGSAFRLGIVDVDAGVTRWLATVTPSRTFLSQELPFFDQYARSHARWSPDGTRLALSVRNAAGREAIWIVDVATGTPLELAAGAMPAWPPVPPTAEPVVQRPF